MIAIMGILKMIMTNNEQIEKLIENIMFLDTETTGVDTKNDDIIELCMENNATTYTMRYNTTREIPPDASAVHFITNSDLDGKEMYSKYAKVNMESINQTRFIVGHNLNFDMDIIYNNTLRSLGESPELTYLNNVDRRICTLELAKKLYAEDDEFKNLTLSYLWFKLEVYKKYPGINITPHKAEDDVRMCRLVFIELVETLIGRNMIDPTNDLGAELVNLCQRPTLYTKMPFGKHKGQLISDVPTSYFEWLVMKGEVLNKDMPTFDRNLEHTVCDELSRRMGLE